MRHLLLFADSIDLFLGFWGLGRVITLLKVYANFFLKYAIT